MATAYTKMVTEPTIMERVTTELDKQLARLDVISEEIKENFEKLMSEVDARRAKLLDQIEKMKTEFETKNKTVVENLRELEKMKDHFENVELIENSLAKKKQQESLAGIDSEIKKLASDIKLNTEIKFSCYADQLIEQVKCLGEVVDQSSVRKSENQNESDYNQKLKAVKTVTGYKPFELIPRYRNDLFPRSNKLHINKHLLYVFSTSSSEKNFPILVFKADSFLFIRKFGKKGCLASCMTVGDEFIYVGHILHSQRNRKRITNHRLILYKLSDYSVVKEGSITEDMCIYDMGFIDNQVFVLCAIQGYVKSLVYDRSLNLLGEVSIDSDEFPKTLDSIPTRFTGNRIYVLYEKRLRVFSISKEKSYLTEKGKN